MRHAIGSVVPLVASLVEWRKFRLRKWLADIHWIDALYQAYLTALIGKRR